MNVNPIDSYLRLISVVKLSKSYDCVLIIAGVDSRNNEHCAKAVQYLVNGSSGIQLHPSSLEEDLEEVILLVHGQGCKVYATPNILHRHSPTFAAWPNCEVFALDARAAADQELLEDHKIETFKRMVEGFTTVGIPSGGSNIEQWPIVQSYALENKGSSGFFSMRRKIVDISQEFVHLYATVDPPTALYIDYQVSTSLRSQWDSLALAIHSHASEWSSIKDKEEKLLEPLKAYFDYGSLRREEELSAFGIQNPRITLNQLDSNLFSSGFASIEYSDAQLPIRVARTYYTGIAQLFPYHSVWHNKNNHTAPELEFLTNVQQELIAVLSLYLMGQETVRTLGDRLAKGSWDGNASEAEAIFAKQCQECNVQLPANSTVRQFVTFKSQRLDLQPFIKACSAPGGGPLKIFYVQIGIQFESLLVNQIKGEIVFGDTFILCDADQFNGSNTINLTECIQSVKLCPLDSVSHTNCTMSATLVKTLLQNLKSKVLTAPLHKELGSLVNIWDISNGLIVSLNGNVKEEDYTLVLFDKAILIVSEELQQCSSTISWEDCSRITVHNEMELGGFVIVDVFFKFGVAVEKGFFPLVLLPEKVLGKRDEVSVSLIFNPYSTCKQQFCSAALPILKKEWERLGLNVEFKDKLDWETLRNRTGLFSRLQKYASNNKFARSEITEESHNKDHKPEFDSLRRAYARDLSVAISGHLQNVQKAYEGKMCIGDNDEVVSVHIISGVAGSGKHALCQQISKLQKGVHIIQQSMHEGIQFKESIWKERIASAHRVANESKRGKVHILCISPGFTPVVQFATTIAKILESVNSTQGGKVLEIQFAGTILNSEMVYMNYLSKPACELVPYFGDLLTLGYTQAVYIIHSGNNTAININIVERLITTLSRGAKVCYTLADFMQSMGLAEGPFTAFGETATAALRAMVVPTVHNPRRSRLFESRCFELNNLIIGQYELNQFIQYTTDPKNKNYFLLVVQAECEGSLKCVRALNSKPLLQRVATKPLLELTGIHRFFLIGVDLQDQSALEHNFASLLHSKASIMKSIVKIHDNVWEEELVDDGKPKPLLARNMLNDEEVRHLTTYRFVDVPVPDGWYFDGVYYRNHSGEKTKERPDLEYLISSYIEEKNQRIKEYNAKIKGLASH